jgi:dTDP-4-dehydrorhamnose 3,5-epimerase
MKLETVSLPGAYLVVPERLHDGRGYFYEHYNRLALEEKGILFDFVQDNVSFSQRVATVRGLHFQSPPSAQTKLVSVLRGAIQDVIVDIRESSPTYGQHLSVDLSAENGAQLLVPHGMAHGFCTTLPETLVLYKTDVYYDPSRDLGVRWNDPALGIKWPFDQAQVTLSERDKALPFLKELPRYFPA